MYICIFPRNLSIYPQTMTLTHKTDPQGTPFLEYFTFHTYLSLGILPPSGHFLFMPLIPAVRWINV